MSSSGAAVSQLWWEIYVHSLQWRMCSTEFVWTCGVEVKTPRTWKDWESQFLEDPCGYKLLSSQNMDSWQLVMFYHSSMYDDATLGRVWECITHTHHLTTARGKEIRGELQTFMKNMTVGNRCLLKWSSASNNTWLFVIILSSLVNYLLQLGMWAAVEVKSSNCCYHSLHNGSRSSCLEQNIYVYANFPRPLGVAH